MSTPVPAKRHSTLQIVVLTICGVGGALCIIVTMLILMTRDGFIPPGFVEPVQCSEVLVAGKVIPPEVLRVGCSLPNRGIRQFTTTPCGAPNSYLYTMDQWFTDDAAKPLKDGRANPGQLKTYTALCSGR